jgi:hypothetical protein
MGSVSVAGAIVVFCTEVDEDRMPKYDDSPDHGNCRTVRLLDVNSGVMVFDVAKRCKGYRYP